MRNLILALAVCSMGFAGCTWDCNIESDAYQPTLDEPTTASPPSLTNEANSAVETKEISGDDVLLQQN